MALGVLDVAPFEVMVEGDPRVAELLLPSQDIQNRVGEMSVKFAERYARSGNGLHVITVLDGAMHFSSDLQLGIQDVEPSLRMTGDTIQLGSYASTTSSGVVRQHSKLTKPIEGLDVLIVEDIFDTGATLGWLISYLQTFKPRSIEVAVLLDKEVPKRAPNILGNIALHSGFKIPDKFVIGYGLDYAGLYRNLRDIYALRAA